MTTTVATTPTRDQKSGPFDDGADNDDGGDGGAGGITDAAVDGADTGGNTGAFISVVGRGGTAGCPTKVFAE